MLTAEDELGSSDTSAANHYLTVHDYSSLSSWGKSVTAGPKKARCSHKCAYSILRILHLSFVLCKLRYGRHAHYSEQQGLGSLVYWSVARHRGEDQRVSCRKPRFSD